MDHYDIMLIHEALCFSMRDKNAEAFEKFIKRNYRGDGQVIRHFYEGKNSQGGHRIIGEIFDLLLNDEEGCEDYGLELNKDLPSASDRVDRWTLSLMHNEEVPGGTGMAFARVEEILEGWHTIWKAFCCECDTELDMDKKDDDGFIECPECGAGNIIELK